MSNKFILILDSSPISTYLECPEQWHNQYGKRLVPSGVPLESHAMNAGTYGHKLLDIYYRQRRRGAGLNDAMAAAFDYDVDKDICECGCNKEHHKDIVIGQSQLQECQRCKKCLHFRSKPFDLPVEQRLAVRNRLRDYFFYYQNNDFIPHSPDHVEVGFSENIYEDAENLFVLEGRIDLLCTLQGLNVIADHKFQMRLHNLYQKSVQFKDYALVSKTTTLVINYIRLSKSVTKDTLVRELVSFTVPELLAWKTKLIKIFFRVKDSIINDTYQQNWAACPGRFNYECAYTKLCEENDPNMKAIKENQLYQIRPVEWRPW